MLENGLLPWLSGRLITFGPGLLFVVCLLETAVFAGLILPVGALIAFAAMLSARGVFSPGEVVAAALLGAFIGDQVGFSVGRWFIAVARPARRDLSRLWAGAIARVDRLIRGHGGIGLTAARAIPFVRTVMPWFAGRSGIGWLRFLFFDVLGVGLWGVVYIGGGFLAGESWRQVADRFGEVVGAVVAVLALVALLALAWPRRLRRTGRSRRHEGHEAPTGQELQ